MSVNLKALRRENLRFLIKKDGNSELAKKIGTSASYLSQIMSETSRGEVGDRFAKQVEESLGLEPGWLNTDHSEGAKTGVVMASEADVIDIANGAKYVPREGREQALEDLGFSSKAFGFAVRTDEMEPDIRAGSRVIVEPELTPESGHICLVLTAGSVFIREIQKNPSGGFLLKPANNRYPVSQAADDVQIVGVVRRAVRDFA